MSLVFKQPTTNNIIPLNFTSRNPEETKRSGFLGILRDLALVGLTVLSFLLPETLPATIALSAVDFGTSVGIDLASARENKASRKNLALNIAVQAIADIVPIAGYALKGANAIKRIGLTVEELRASSLSSHLESDIKIITKDLNIGNAASRRKLLGEKILKAGERSRLLQKEGLISSAQRLNDLDAGLSAFNTLGFRTAVSRGTLNGEEANIINKQFLVSSQADAEQEAFKAMEQYGSNLDFQKQYDDFNKFYDEMEFSKQTNISSKQAYKLWEFQNTQKIYSKFGIQGFIKFFNSKQGYKLTQKVQLFNSNDFARENLKWFVGKIRKHLPRQMKAWMRSVREALERNFHISSAFKKIRDRIARGGEGYVKFTNSAWIDGFRAINLDDLGLTFTVVVYFKEPQYSPRYIRGVPRFQVEEFMYADLQDSAGSWYKRHWALSQNGRDISSAISWTAGALYAALPLNALRNIESIITNIKGTIKSFSKSGNVIHNWIYKYFETIGRNAPTRLGREFSRIMLGGGGIIANQSAKFTSATLKSINLQKVSQGLGTRIADKITGDNLLGQKGHPVGKIHFNGRSILNAAITSVGTGFTRAGGGKNRAYRVSNRYVKTLSRGINIIRKK